MKKHLECFRVLIKEQDKMEKIICRCYNVLKVFVYVWR